MNDPRPDGVPPDFARGFGLLATKLVLVMFAAGLVAVGDRPQFWPLTKWSMYAHSRAEMPPVVSRYEVVATARGGDQSTFLVTQLFPYEGCQTCEYVLGRAAIESSQRGEVPGPHVQVTVNLVGRAWGRRDITELEIWEKQFEVRPLDLPPLDIETPSRIELLARIPVDPDADYRRDDW